MSISEKIFDYFEERIKSMSIGEKKTKAGKKNSDAEKEVNLKSKATAIVAASGRARNGKADVVPQQKVVVDSDQIAKRAFTIWQSQGCPKGREMENWLEAERQLKSEAK